jgi:hypothetical protein
MNEDGADIPRSSAQPGKEPRWFERIGAPLDEPERAALAQILARHFPAVEIVHVASWSDARVLLEAEARDSRLWDAQEAERERLWDLGTDRHTEADLVETLQRAEAAASEALREAAARAAGRLAAHDARLAAEVAGAARLALHHSALATLADAGDAHPFHATLAVFARGRWPLGLSGGRFFIF